MVMATLIETARDKASTANCPHPVHAIANFGFGGRLCVMIPQAFPLLSLVMVESLCYGLVVGCHLHNLVLMEHDHSRQH